MTFLKPEIIGPGQGTLMKGERTSRMTGEFGIYGRDGQPIPYSDVVCDIYTSSFAQMQSLPEPVQTITEPCFFAGIARVQFGHVLLNALGRLWALNDLPHNTTLVFTAKGRPKLAQFPHIRTVLDALDVKNPIRVVTAPTKFENIYTASEQFGERYDGRGTVHFYRWLDSRLPKPGPAANGAKLYVSRTGLGQNSGRFTCEGHLESLLADDGYEIMHPENHSLTEQFVRYLGARKVIFAEGSALHAFALVRQPDQKAAVIQRRTALPTLIQTQMDDRAGSPVLKVNAIKSRHWPPARSDHLSVATLDFAALGRQLQASGFLSSLSQWTPPSAEAEVASLNAGLAPGETMLGPQERTAFLRQLRKNRRERLAKKA